MFSYFLHRLGHPPQLFLWEQQGTKDGSGLNCGHTSHPHLYCLHAHLFKWFNLHNNVAHITHCMLLVCGLRVRSQQLWLVLERVAFSVCKSVETKHHYRYWSFLQCHHDDVHILIYSDMHLVICKDRGYVAPHLCMHTKRIDLSFRNQGNNPAPQPAGKDWASADIKV